MTAQPHKCVVVLAVMEVLSTVCAELHMFSVRLAVVVMLTDDMLKSAVVFCGCTEATGDCCCRLLQDAGIVLGLASKCSVSSTVCAQPHKRVVMLVVMEVLPTVCAELHMFSVLLAVVVVLTDDMLKSAVDFCGCTEATACVHHCSCPVAQERCDAGRDGGVAHCLCRAANVLCAACRGCDVD